MQQTAAVGIINAVEKFAGNFAKLTKKAPHANQAVEWQSLQFWIVSVTLGLLFAGGSWIILTPCSCQTTVSTSRVVLAGYAI
ncbi:hypothetical protein CF326_g7333 [Tilletia indica]|nr:hypothetical protein CF326_g7333 [Tilletia indica]